LVPSSDIYYGAIPWVFLQLLLVAIVIYWPQSVTYWIDSGPKVDPSKIEIRIPSFGNQPGAPLNIPGLTPPATPPPAPQSGSQPPAAPVLPSSTPGLGQLSPDLTPPVQSNAPPPPASAAPSSPSGRPGN
jgi:hypothetical protein